MITLKNLSKQYDGRAVFTNRSLAIAKGEFLSLFGPNGCGKSTMLRIIAGIEKADSGFVIGSEGELERVAVVFQNYRETLLPWRTVRENILFPLQLQGMNRKQQQERLRELLDQINPTFSLDQFVYTLSGGQAQLVSLLRAVIVRPTLLLLDEPTSALDWYNNELFFVQLAELRNIYRFTVIAVIHDFELAVSVSDRVVGISNRPELQPIELAAGSDKEQLAAVLHQLAYR